MPVAVMCAKSTLAHCRSTDMGVRCCLWIVVHREAGHHEQRYRSIAATSHTLNIASNRRVDICDQPPQAILTHESLGHPHRVHVNMAVLLTYSPLALKGKEKDRERGATRGAERRTGEVGGE